MSTMDWAMVPRRSLAAVRSAGCGAQVLLVAFGLSLFTGCNIELGGPIWVRPTQHPVGHLLGFVAAMVVAASLVSAIVEVAQWIAKRARHHRPSSPDGRWRALRSPFGARRGGRP